MMNDRRRFWMRLGLAVMLAGLLAGPAFAQAGNVLWQEDFEGYAENAPLDGQNGWTMLKVADAPAAVVKSGAGLKNSRGLVLSNTKAFRSDYIGLTRTFPQALTGTLWIQCRFKAPAAADNWIGGFNIKSNLAGFSAGLLREKDKPDQIRFVVPYWQGYRIHRTVPYEGGRWYTLTLKLDNERKTYSAWVDDVELGSDLDVGAGELKSVYLSSGGKAEDPAVVDDLIITRSRPAGITERPLYPAGKPGRLFRFAAMGDPQPGLGNYAVELIHFQRAVRQVNESGAEFTLILGDLVHDGKVDTTYQDIVETARGFGKPWYPVRGNHDAPEKFKKYFKPELNYSFEHKDFRFVMLDAIGGQEELTAEQLAWVEKEFQAAKAKKQEIVVCTHVSAWDENARGVSPYMQIGPESKAKLKELYKKYDALLMLSGHYHRGPWYAQEEGMNYLVLGGTGFVRSSPTGWSVVDVYPDRLEIYTKPVFFPCEDEKTTEFYDMPYLEWRSYESYRTGQGVAAKLHFPYLVRSPLVIKRKAR